MYEELVKRLHERIALTTAGTPLQDDLLQAADAIEDLQKLTDAQLDVIKQHQAHLTKQRWIPVEERLPEMGKEVLVSDKHKGVNIAWIVGCFSKDGASFEWACESDGWIDDQIPITHWMPLPQPPEEET